MKVCTGCGKYKRIDSEFGIDKRRNRPISSCYDCNHLGSLNGLVAQDIGKLLEAALERLRHEYFAREALASPPPVKTS